MREIRIFHPIALEDDTTIELSEGAARHLLRVLRLDAGSPFVLFDGSGREWQAIIENSKAGTARVAAGRVAATESPLHLTLVQGISRGERMDWTIQKAVELGVSRIVPVFTARTTVKLDEGRATKRHQHWLSIIQSACEQSGRVTIPKLEPAGPFVEWLRQATGTVLTLDPRASAGLADACPENTQSIALLVGPEGGLDDGELDAAITAGCVPVQLGPRILRTETAGLTALAILQSIHGDLKSRSAT